MIKGLNKLYQKNLQYKKIGVLLLEISSFKSSQFDLFHEIDNKIIERMKVIDKINSLMGKGKLKFAVEGLQKAWQMRNDYRSPCYTTRWEDIPSVKAN